MQTIPTAGKLVLNWNSATNLKLEESSGLSGWSTFEEAHGSDSYLADPSNGGSKFFRLTE